MFIAFRSLDFAQNQFLYRITFNEDSQILAMCGILYLIPQLNLLMLAIVLSSCSLSALLKADLC